MIDIAHQVRWNAYILETFIKEGCLTELEEGIMRTRVKGLTVTQQALMFHVSKSTVEKTIAKLKRIYDEVQRINPELPERKFSAKETYMDTH